MISKTIYVLFTTITLVFPAITDNILLVEDGYGAVGENNATPVSIRLTSTDTLSGIQLETRFDNYRLALDTVIAVGRCEAFDLFYHQPRAGSVSLVLVSTEGRTIMPGSDSILEFHFTVRSWADTVAAPFTIEEFVLTDAMVSRRSGISADGYFFVEGQNYLRISNGLDSFKATLYNILPVAGVQLRLTYENTRMEPDSVMKTNRSNHFDLSYNITEPGELVVLLYSLSGNILQTGSGEIFRLQFRNDDHTIADLNSIQVKEVILSDTNGLTLDAVAFPGNGSTDRFDITGLPEDGIGKHHLDALNFQLFQNYPNPFNPATMIRYSVGATGFSFQYVNLAIYNPLGQKIITLVSEYQAPGQYEVRWDAGGYADGLYFCKLTIGNFQQMRKMILLR